MQSNRKKSNKPNTRTKFSAQDRTVARPDWCNELSFTNDQTINIYDRKIAYLVSLLTQVKALTPRYLHEILEIERIENTLNLPEISDRNWEEEKELNQTRFHFFLNSYISFYEHVLDILKRKTES